MGLAVSAELLLVIVNAQRGGLSTGLPTKMEQADLNQALFGRHGEAPMPVLAARSPSDAFDTVIEASRIALRHMTPVMVLTDGNIANGTEPWQIPDPDGIAAIDLAYHTDAEHFKPYGRDFDTGATVGHSGYAGLWNIGIGGLEKEHESGNISYDPDNHELMTKLRADKVAKVADFYEPAILVTPTLIWWLSASSPFGPDRLRDEPCPRCWR